MKTRLLALLLAAVAPVLNGCLGRGDLFTLFESDRSHCVGKRFMDRASAWCLWEDAIARREIDARTEEYLMATDFMGLCRWVYVVDRQSRLVTGWRIESGHEDCYARIDWLGPW